MIIEGRGGRPASGGLDGFSLRNGPEDADARYRRLIEQSGVGLFQTATSGRVLWLNSAAARICGYEDAADFLSTVENIRDLYVDVSRRDEFVRLVEEYGSVSGFEYEIRHKDGSIRWIGVDARGIRNEAGDLEGFEGTVQDVTDRKLLEASTRAMSSKLDPFEAVSSVAEILRRVIPFRHLTLAVIEGDSFRRLVSLGSPPDEARLPTGESVLLHGKSMGEVARTGRSLLMKDTSVARWEFDRELHSVGIHSYAIFPLIDEDGVFATFNVGMDEPDAIGEDAFDLLAKHAAGMAHGAKNILAFEKQREILKELEELDAVKNEFFASVSHELRNPLAVISGITDTLQRRWEHLPDERKLEMLKSVSGSAERVLAHLKRDLEVALLESGDLRYETRVFELGELVAESVRALSDSEPDREVSATIPERLPPVFGDPQRYMQVIGNLLSNALKFSPPDSAIRVEVEPLEGELQVSVSDEGPGLDEQERQLVFRRLRRLHEGQPGTGIGLYIARSMVEAQGGRIWAESEPGRGARFNFTVPLAP